MLKFAAAIAVAGMIFFVADVQQVKAQVVTTYYAPAPAVGFVPVRRGLFGLRRGYVPVVTGTVAVPVTTMYAPAPITTYSPMVTTYYAPPAPVPVATVRVAPVRTFYAPAPVLVAPVPVTTFYAPTVIIGR